MDKKEKSTPPNIIWLMTYIAIIVILIALAVALGLAFYNIFAGAL